MYQLTAWWNCGWKLCKLDVRPRKHIQESCVTLSRKRLPTRDPTPWAFIWCCV